MEYILMFLMCVVYLSVWIMFGVICKTMAEKRGRDKWLGFVAGLVFGLLAIIYYWWVGLPEE